MASQQSVITVKAYFLNEVRRFQISTASTFEELKQTFYSFLSAQQVQDIPKLVFLYQDDEEDWCKISNESEFREALRISKHLLRLKITREPQAQQANNGMNVDSGSDSSSSSSSSSSDASNSNSGWPRCGGRGGYKRGHCPRGFGWGNHHGSQGGHGHHHGSPFGFHPYFMQQKFANCIPQLIEMFTKGAATGGCGENSGASASSSSDHVVHAHIVCDSCNEKGIRGVRHKCNQCPDYDLCSKCYRAKDKFHDPKHTFTSIENPILGWVSQMMSNIANHTAQYQQEQEESNTKAPAASSSQSTQKNEPMEEEIVLEDAADQILYAENGKAPASSSAEPAQPQVQQVPQQQDAPFNVSLLSLESMGFTNRNLNLHLLKQFNGNVEKVVEALIKFNSYSSQ